MRITLPDEGLLGDLLRFLREEGCIAYVDATGSGIEVIRPHSFGADERAEVEALVERWRLEHPGAEPVLTDS